MGTLSARLYRATLLRMCARSSSSSKLWLCKAKTCNMHERGLPYDSMHRIITALQPRIMLGISLKVSSYQDLPQVQVGYGVRDG